MLRKLVSIIERKCYVPPKEPLLQHTYQLPDPSILTTEVFLETLGARDPFPIPFQCYTIYVLYK